VVLTLRSHFGIWVLAVFLRGSGEEELLRGRAKMANGAEREMVLLFSEEELREMSGVKRGGDYIEVMCGCTSHRYGDAVGRLRVFINGELEITCECTPGCDEGLFS
jgi:hypothetical protein